MRKQKEEEIRQKLAKIAAIHTYLNGKKNYDGSLGEVKITPYEFHEALFLAYLEGYIADYDE